ncbi:MAG: hypothetical protein Q8Q04_02745 [archaeon]|nr:hypothetical protein [archaeon]
MDCCKTKDDDGCCKDLDNISHNLKGGKTKMKRNVLLWGVIAVLFVAALILMFQTGASVGVQSVGGATQSVTSTSSGMVGGC